MNESTENAVLGGGCLMLEAVFQRLPVYMSPIHSNIFSNKSRFRMIFRNRFNIVSKLVDLSVCFILFITNFSYIVQNDPMPENHQGIVHIGVQKFN